MKINMLRYILVLVLEVPGGGPNKSLAGLWPTSANVAIHVLRETGITVRPEKLRTKYDTYTSFLIPVKKNSRRYNILLEANNWPMGCLVRPFER